MKTPFGKVAVLFGGNSNEREVSLVSGQAVLEALQKGGVDAYLFDPSEQPLEDLKKKGFDRVFIALHGGHGEDGAIQGALEFLGIPYTGCGVMASAIGMDKWRSKLVWEAAGLPVTPYRMLDAQTNFKQVEEELGLPLFVKAACGGSSLDVYKVKESGELEKYFNQMKENNDLILAEQFISGGEYTCGILGNRALPTIKIVPKTEFYDYEAKYNRDDTEYLCPSDLSEEDEQKLRDLCFKAYQVIGGTGWGRVDFLKDADGQYYLMEANTSPGMTSHSLVPKAAKQLGISFESLCVEILTHASLG